MSCLLVTYDLNQPGQDYSKLYDKIKSLGSAWWHHLDSTWLVATNLSVSEAAEKLRSVMDASDSLLVIDITGDSYNGWLDKKAWEWIHKHVGQTSRRAGLY